MPDWEPYVRIWREANGAEVAMLAVEGYRRLCRVVEAVDAFDQKVAEFGFAHPDSYLTDDYQRVHDALFALKPKEEKNATCHERQTDPPLR